MRRNGKGAVSQRETGRKLYPIQYIERSLVRLGLSPGHESFSKLSMGRDDILFIHMAPLIIRIVPGSQETLSDCMQDYLINMQIMLFKTEFPIL